MKNSAALISYNTVKRKTKLCLHAYEKAIEQENIDDANKFITIAIQSIYINCLAPTDPDNEQAYANLKAASKKFDSRRDIEQTRDLLFMIRTHSKEKNTTALERYAFEQTMQKIIAKCLSFKMQYNNK